MRFRFSQINIFQNLAFSLADSQNDNMMLNEMYFQFKYEEKKDVKY